MRAGFSCSVKFGLIPTLAVVVDQLMESLGKLYNSGATKKVALRKLM